MSGKVVSLFDHPEFVRRTQARAERELSEQVLPVVWLGRGRFHCRRCARDFEATARLHPNPTKPEPCPHCQAAPEHAALEAFLGQVLREP